MAYRSRNDTVRRNSLRGSKANPRRRKQPSALSKVRRERPTAHNQKRQIARVTALAIANRKRFRSVYTDWQISPTSDPTDTGFGFNLANATWQVIRLTNFDQWIPVLRQDTNVQESNHTFVKRLQINMRLQVATGWATANFFIVRTRFPEATRDLFSAPPSIGGSDFTENSQLGGANIRLNAAKFKILASRYCTVKTAPRGSTPLPDPNPNFQQGNPTPAEQKWQWNVNVNMKVHNPSPVQNGAAKWPAKAFETLPYYDRIYLMCYSAFDAASTRGGWYADSLATCINNL